MEPKFRVKKKTTTKTKMEKIIVEPEFPSFFPGIRRMAIQNIKTKLFFCERNETTATNISDNDVCFNYNHKDG